ncbi:hypothetical protein D3C79_818030 [compost metagenome]
MRRLAANGRQVRAGNDARQRLRPADRHIQTVFRVQEANVPGQVVFIRCGHRNDDNFSLLPLKLIHSADARARRQHLLQQLYLQVVGRYHQDVFKADRVLLTAVIHKALTQKVGIQRFDVRSLFIGTLAVAVMFDRAEHQPAGRHFRSLPIEQQHLPLGPRRQ